MTNTRQTATTAPAPKPAGGRRKAARNTQGKMANKTWKGVLTMKILILKPIFGYVLQEWGYDLYDEVTYSARSLYEVKNWVRRFNKWSGENLTVRVEGGL